MRKYVQPAVESEEMLEQTSLACNVTNLAEASPDCAQTYRKSETYFNNEILECEIVLIQGGCMVALS
ncbi:MAG: hypothetical protein AB8I69_07050 [Anaerolineae bacterium]|jgi:hypothetical protein